jgi:hypothetical protein
MSYLFRYLYSDVSAEIFDDIGQPLRICGCVSDLPSSDFTDGANQLVDFMFEVISCSVRNVPSKDALEC